MENYTSDQLYPSCYPEPTNQHQVTTSIAYNDSITYRYDQQPTAYYPQIDNYNTTNNDNNCNVYSFYNYSDPENPFHDANSSHNYGVSDLNNNHHNYNNSHYYNFSGLVGGNVDDWNNDNNNHYVTNQQISFDGVDSTFSSQNSNNYGYNQQQYNDSNNWSHNFNSDQTYSELNCNNNININDFDKNNNNLNNTIEHDFNKNTFNGYPNNDLNVNNQTSFSELLLEDTTQLADRIIDENINNEIVKENLLNHAEEKTPRDFSAGNQNFVNESNKIGDSCVNENIKSIEMNNFEGSNINPIASENKIGKKDNNQKKENNNQKPRKVRQKKIDKTSSKKCAEINSTKLNDQIDQLDSSSLSNNSKTTASRVQKRPVPEEFKDEKYRAKRCKNNEAARKCRHTKMSLDVQNEQKLNKLTDELKLINKEIASYESFIEKFMGVLEKYESPFTLDEFDPEKLTHEADNADDSNGNDEEEINENDYSDLICESENENVEGSGTTTNPPTTDKAPASTLNHQTAEQSLNAANLLN